LLHLLFTKNQPD